MSHFKKIFLIIFFLILISFSLLARENIIYKVEKGDTLQKIAKSFKVNIKEIIELNNINDPDVIKVGQQIKIPSSNNIIKYTIKKGDTISKIANKHQISKEKIIQENNIDNPDKIYPGQDLILSSTETAKNQKKENQKTEEVFTDNFNKEFIWPVQGKISSDYGWRNNPNNNQFHNGIDISVSRGSPVYAVADGIVSFSEWSNRYDNLIIVTHNNNIKTYYAHNLKLLVEKGDKVDRGKIIALSGNTDNSNDSHLHFEIRKNNQTLDPLDYLNKKYMENGFNI